MEVHDITNNPAQLATSTIIKYEIAIARRLSVVRRVPEATSIRERTPEDSFFESRNGNDVNFLPWSDPPVATSPVRLKTTRLAHCEWNVIVISPDIREF